MIEKRNKDIELCVISKFQPKKVTMINLGGNLGYYNSVSIIEFNNIIIYNCYFQAGSSASPGQEYKWLHYSRCRSQQFKHIKDLISKIDKPVIVLGDFNCHLDGKESDWPELKYLHNINLRDSLRELHPDKLGLTENTDVNHLRFNSKFEPKHFRYDAILFNKLKPKSSIIVGDSPQLIEDDETNRLYEEVILPPGGLQNKDLKVAMKKDNKNCYNLFVSDHFGLMTTFIF